MESSLMTQLLKVLRGPNFGGCDGHKSNHIGGRLQPSRFRLPWDREGCPGAGRQGHGLHRAGRRATEFFFTAELAEHTEFSKTTETHRNHHDPAAHSPILRISFLVHRRFRCQRPNRSETSSSRRRWCDREVKMCGCECGCPGLRASAGAGARAGWSRLSMAARHAKACALRCRPRSSLAGICRLESQRGPDRVCPESESECFLHFAKGTGRTEEGPVSLR